MSVSQCNWALWASCQYLSDMFTKDIEATFSGCNFGKYQNNRKLRKKYCVWHVIRLVFLNTSLGIKNIIKNQLNYWKYNMMAMAVYFTSILMYVLTFYVFTSYVIFQVRLTDWGLQDTNKTVKNLPKQNSLLDVKIMVCQQSLC